MNPKDAPQQGSGRCSCGKKSFVARDDAKLAKVRMKSRGRDVSGLQVFKCSVCGWFHLGHNQGIDRWTLRNHAKKKFGEAA